MCSTLLKNITFPEATPLVKNTFIDCVNKPIVVAKRRNKSLPPSFRVGGERSDEHNELPPLSFNMVDSDDSTDVRTEASPRSDDAPSSDAGNMSSDAPSTGNGHAGLCACCAGATSINSGPQVSNAYNAPPLWPQTVSAGPIVWTQPPEVSPEHLSSKAAAYEPTQQPSQPLSQTDLDSHTAMAQMMEEVKQVLQRSPEIAIADLTQSLNGWFLVVAPAKNKGASGNQVLALTKRALLAAAEASKNVYVLGYEALNVAFATKAQGFESQLAVMGNAHRACWRTFKEGFCASGAACGKEHPILEVPVRVFLEAAQIEYTAIEPVVRFINQNFANCLMTIISMLTSSTGVAVSLFNLGGEGWSIEIPVLFEHSNLREQLLSLAQSAFMEASQQSKNVVVMRFGGMPFIPKSNGFVCMFGDMSNPHQACWDVYRDGVCSRKGACGWQHPQCLVPVNVVLKQMEPPTVDGFVADADFVLEALQEWPQLPA